MTQEIITEVKKFESGEKGVTFRSMGQEVNAALNNRRILNVVGYLNELLLFGDKWKGHMVVLSQNKQHCACY